MYIANWKCKDQSIQMLISCEWLSFVKTIETNCFYVTKSIKFTKVRCSRFEKYLKKYTNISKWSSSFVDHYIWHCITSRRKYINLVITLIYFLFLILPIYVFIWNIAMLIWPLTHSDMKTVSRCINELQLTDLNINQFSD